jgi:hypothetical protein
VPTNKAKQTNNNKKVWGRDLGWQEDLTYSKTHYKTLVIKTGVLGTDIDISGREEGPQIDPHFCAQLIFDKATKVIWWGKYCPFTNWFCNNWVPKWKAIITFIPLYTISGS